MNSFSLHKYLSDLSPEFLRVFPGLYCKPYIPTIFVNGRCNSRCITCNYWKYKSEDLSKELIDKFINEIIEWLGPVWITLTGGEPLLREDIFEIIDNIHSKGGRARMLTNGLLLNKKIIDRLVESHLFSIAISVNSINPKIHDASRGVKGNLARIFNAVEYIRKKYPKQVIEFMMIIYDHNLDQIIPTIEYANENGIYLNFQPIQPLFSKYPSTEEDKDIFQELLPKNLEKLSGVLQEIKKYKLRDYRITLFNSYLDKYLNYFSNPNTTGIKKCRIGFYNLILENNGDMKLCEYYTRLGNIRDISPERAWKSDIAKKQRRQMSKCAKGCPAVMLCNMIPNFMDLLEAVANKNF